MILAALAVTDGLVMLIYTPYAFDHAFDFSTRDERFTYGYSLYIFLHATLTLTIHTISTFLTILLAFYRYICVCRNSSRKSFIKRTTPMIVFSCIFAITLSLPMYLSLTINETTTTTAGSNRTIYYVASTEFQRHHETIYFWIYSVIIKLLPCILLTFFTIKLIQVLLKAKKSSALTNNGVSSNLFKRRRNQSDRTTALLVSVLILFLLTQFPQAIFGLFSALHRRFYEKCYHRMGKLLEG